MAQSFKFDLVSPERLLVSQDVESVVIPGTEGELTVMATHAPTMTSIKPGVVAVTAGGKTERYVVFGGFADILPDGCTVLAESAVHVDDINREDIARRIQEAREDLEDAGDHEARLRAEDFLHQLTTLEGAILPA
ncbi:F0F1 ATP synthase subunit epsilon [Nitratireductor aquimarinus]|uniref:ATP synthase epsilon chain n=1 Tax=Nitratireductor aquimarinus TaxID=889300 RepID=A0ABU4AHV7_9HYPH|nr:MULTISPECIES: F0F1 ATP synthase subunit epsilon [Alphaproteobacteria]MBY6021860.1 F0F1 ATP synthase subunit epsilon [Nitratireductor sp. DP7N14-4]MBN7757073.1 F0F1 ATP synthase subunit epsilon [Nitratireductor aquimarinus]MBN7761015.1 F0F1 ATP synthase subunit epsilon [Nitratireductor aquibiodomus]MBN7777389.1 F0F1 ATP synthase subunit epsilon [Nitratireductor pacificus]MBN7781060.1 F0F1 ATP synthase subunit epsilon [Nitratireductor pacificus]